MPDRIEADEFFVGYHDSPPRRLRGFLIRVIAGTLVAAGGITLTLALAQSPFAPATFEFGQVRSIQGRVGEHPYPTLLVPRPGRAPGESDAVSQYLLVAQGKHGAQNLVRGLDGRAVELRGSLIYRGNRTMVEVVKHSIRGIPSTEAAFPPFPTGEDLGMFTLLGEIVDGKCYMGVMNPGVLKTHHGCAVRCLSGGTTPLFILRDSSGVAEQLILVSAAGAPLRREVLPFVAVPVQITGRVERQGELLLLHADPSTYRRVP